MANSFQKLIDGIRSNLSLIVKGVFSGIFLILGPLLAMLVRIGEADIGIIITVGMISEVIGLMLFWLIIRTEYLAGLDPEERKATFFEKIRSKLFSKESKKSQE
ncbi:MAG: hypothetical protein JW776_03115 [Candidatus Lokiarchaeota archaeon]|nr:hypothetical protein [Candidatus Lokiarchaeota archaeon]